MSAWQGKNICEEKIVGIWGTGAYFNKIQDKLFRECKVGFLIDSSPENRNKLSVRLGLKCISPEEIKEKNIDIVLIAVIDKKASYEIEAYLKGQGIDYSFADYYLDELQMARVKNIKDNEARNDVLKRVIFVQIPTMNCNMKCSYCYLIQNDSECLRGEHERYPHRPEFIAKALSRYRIGGTTYFDLTSWGESLLYRDIVPLTRMLLEDGHIVSITTNGTASGVIDKLLEIGEEYIERLFLRFSFHFTELKRLGITDIFFKNVRKVRRSKASFTVMMVASDNYLPYKEMIKALFIQELGALPHLDFVRESTRKDYELLSEKTKEQYMNEWSDFDSKKFEHRKYFYGRKITEYCHAGDKCTYLNIFSGDLFPCSQMSVIANIYDDICESIKFKEYGDDCPCEWCVNSIIWANFGALETPWQGDGYAETFNRVDMDGNSWIKHNLYELLNQKVIG